MDLSRRQLLGAGLCAGFIATTAQSSTLIEPAVRSLAAAPVPARPHIVVDPAIEPDLLARARRSFDRHRGALRHTDLVGIADFSRPSREARFFLLETNTGRVSKHLVAHGRGSDPDHSGFLERFSNAVGSEASSAGGYVTGDYYPGKYGRSLRLRGLDGTNSNAEARAIVVHSAWYAEAEQVALHGKLGRSEGCFALGYDSLQEVLQRLGPGRFLYADKVA
ncbi:MAG: murein L,D-transpeptidase catalytic domain family protein [Alphaproteobacteria bacterium]|nr:murein L,D-transpeptidase catalytic domain family protein [Alphaproteobacteria bacterium]MBV9371074.1 murein L,D-transpeptidase catalytic domain family protein [Alphaproteobacteria bacterium]MBV9901552.1 murein L,D-transpeptidase catalytic domain family protein [Alphaproteobacteria bacterium]